MRVVQIAYHYPDLLPLHARMNVHLFHQCSQCSENPVAEDLVHKHSDELSEFPGGNQAERARAGRKGSQGRAEQCNENPVAEDLGGDDDG